MPNRNPSDVLAIEFSIRRHIWRRNSSCWSYPDFFRFHIGGKIALP